MLTREGVVLERRFGRWTGNVMRPATFGRAFFLGRRVEVWFGVSDSETLGRLSPSRRKPRLRPWLWPVILQAPGALQEPGEFIRGRGVDEGGEVVVAGAGVESAQECGGHGVERESGLARCGGHLPHEGQSGPVGVRGGFCQALDDELGQGDAVAVGGEQDALKGRFVLERVEVGSFSDVVEDVGEKAGGAIGEHGAEGGEEVSRARHLVRCGLVRAAETGEFAKGLECDRREVGLVGFSRGGRRGPDGGDVLEGGDGHGNVGAGGREEGPRHSFACRGRIVSARPADALLCHNAPGGEGRKRDRKVFEADF